MLSAATTYDWRMTNAKERKLERLEDIPNVGKAIAADLRLLGFQHAGDLSGQDPYDLYDRINAATGRRQDPCLLDTFIAAVRYVEGGPRLPWWAFTAERKRTLAERTPRD
jgi:hypothetical protein